jgi:hypothetical protein
MRARLLPSCCTIVRLSNLINNSAGRAVDWVFRQAPWLTADRACAWQRVLAVLLVIRIVPMLVRPADGDIIGTDFVCYWVAAGFAAAGNAATAYNDAAMSAAEHAAVSMPADAAFGFFYPPSFLLLLLPLAALPFIPALLTFLAAGLIPYVVTLRRLLPQRWAWLPILVAPSVVVTAGSGQNGFLSAACLGGYMVLLDKRPLLAGACLGLLSYKPHLMIGAPFALVAARRWRALFGAACSACLLALLAFLVLGGPAWADFAAALPRAGSVVVYSLADPTKLQSVFGGFRILHLPLAAGYVTQGVVTLAALAMLTRVAARRPGGYAEGAMLAAVALVCSPYLFDYDLPILSLPLGIENSFLPWEKILLLAAYILPVMSRGLAGLTHIPVAPFVLCAVVAAVARRCGADGLSQQYREPLLNQNRL